jgi:hypothetical protein
MLTHRPDSCIASREWQARYAACPSVLTIPWRRVTVSQGRSVPA